MHKSLEEKALLLIKISEEGTGQDIQELVHSDSRHGLWRENVYYKITVLLEQNRDLAKKTCTAMEKVGITDRLFAECTEINEAVASNAEKFCTTTNKAELDGLLPQVEADQEYLKTFNSELYNKVSEKIAEQ